MRVAGALVLALALVLLLAGGEDAAPPRAAQDPVPEVLPSGTAPLPIALRLGDPRDPVRDGFRRPPKAGLLFDVGTGEVLWRRRPTKPVPVASLTKMMTALIVAERTRPGERARVSRTALDYSGSGVGVLPRGRRVGIGGLLHGLMLPSGNDAARVLAEHVSGSIPAFVRLMNERAAQLGLTCTRFASPDGLDDRGRSCAADLAALARAVLREPLLARIVARRSAVFPLPGKRRRMWLYNHNPLLRMRYPGTTGLKTGYTGAAGRCLVATVRRGSLHLGVVLLDSPDTGRQARHLLDRAFRQLG